VLFLAAFVYAQNVSAAPNTNALSKQDQTAASANDEESITNKERKSTQEPNTQKDTKSIKIEIKNGKTIFKADDQSVVELKSEETEASPIKLDDKDGSGQIKISTKKDSFFISKSKIQARTNFPLTVNFETNELQVTTPKGTKTVTVLPDKAVEGMLKAGIIDKISQLPVSEPEGSESGSLVDAVELTTDSKNSLVYKIDGEKTKKIFGIIPVKFKKTAYVSAETGSITPLTKSPFDKIIDLIAF